MNSQSPAIMGLGANIPQRRSRAEKSLYQPRFMLAVLPVGDHRGFNPEQR
jgi:hypothetical protein